MIICQIYLFIQVYYNIIVKNFIEYVAHKLVCLWSCLTLKQLNVVLFSLKIWFVYPCISIIFSVFNIQQRSWPIIRWWRFRLSILNDIYWKCSQLNNLHFHFKEDAHKIIPAWYLMPFYYGICCNLMILF